MSFEQHMVEYFLGLEQPMKKTEDKISGSLAVYKARLLTEVAF